jgi:hypothetical protein
MFGVGYSVTPTGTGAAEGSWSGKRHGTSGQDQQGKQGDGHTGAAFFGSGRRVGGCG